MNYSKHILLCEICQKPGDKKYKLDNDEMTVCERCLKKDLFTKEEMQLIHNYKLAGRPQKFLK